MGVINKYRFSFTAASLMYDNFTHYVHLVVKIEFLLYWLRKKVLIALVNIEHSNSVLNLVLKIINNVDE
jgi:hypothetical protein